jgi:hypothetical protein
MTNWSYLTSDGSSPSAVVQNSKFTKCLAWSHFAQHLPFLYDLKLSLGRNIQMRTCDQKLETTGL